MAVAPPKPLLMRDDLMVQVYGIDVLDPAPVIAQSHEQARDLLTQAWRRAGSTTPGLAAAGTPASGRSADIQHLSRLDQQKVWPNVVPSCPGSAAPTLGPLQGERDPIQRPRRRSLTGEPG